MTPKGMQDDAAIRNRIESMTQAIRAKDVDALMSHYAPDVVVNDVTSPLDAQGADAYRKKFERWFDSISGELDYEMQDLHVFVGDQAGHSYGTSHVHGTRKNGTPVDYRLKVTTEFHKVNGQWMVDHEHISLPEEEI